MESIKRIISIILALLLLPVSAYASTANNQLNRAYWPLQEQFEAAVNGGNHTGIISVGEQIIALFLDGAYPEEKANQWQAMGGSLELDILRNITQAVAESYEAIGDLDGAIRAYTVALPIAVAWQEVNAPIDTEFVRTIYLNKISAYTVNSAVYAEFAGDGGRVVYHGAKFEPVTGALYGEVYSHNENERVRSEKTPSASLFYVIYETEDITSFDWMLRPLTETRDIVEIAWNLLHEGNTLPNVLNEVAKIEAAADYLASLDIPIWLRFGAEMNVWEIKADPDQFIAAFRLVSRIMKERAPNVAMLWSPNVIGHIETSYDMFYPGDEYVDWVGVSLYTLNYFQGNKSQDATTQAMYLTGSFANPVKSMEQLVAQYGGRKPIMLSETGVENYSNSNNEFVNEWAKPKLHATYLTVPMIYPEIKAYLYFNTNPPHIWEPYRFTLYDNQEMHDLYVELTANPFFIPRGENNGSVTYQKLEGAVAMPTNAVTLLTYAPYVLKADIHVTYQLNGEWIGSSPIAPYRQTFDWSSIGDGTHELDVIIASGGSALEALTYSVIKTGDVVSLVNAN